MLFHVPNTQICWKESSISYLAKGRRSELVLGRHQCWSVTSQEREVLVLWRHIRRRSLHAQAVAKLMLTTN